MRYGASFADTAIRNCRQSGLTVKQPKYLRVFPVRFPNGRHEHTPALRLRAVGLIMAAAVTMVTYVGSASGSNECPDASNAPGDQSQVG